MNNHPFFICPLHTQIVADPVRLSDVTAIFEAEIRRRKPWLAFRVELHRHPSPLLDSAGDRQLEAYVADDWQQMELFA